MYREIKGDLIKLSLEGKFDVIVHGCNCFCTMGAGIAPQMNKHFGCATYPMELIQKGDINKLGNIDYQKRVIEYAEFKKLIIVNAYTQYFYGQNSPNCTQALDYEALTLCLRKINHIFTMKHIGLPQIGCGLAGGDWEIVKEIIKKELNDCKVTVVIYEKS